MVWSFGRFQAVPENSTKIHYPNPQNEGARYRTIHYTVRLREDRLRLPEYATFAGLRCEIQIQTILEHAWAETSHDILYKNKLSDGYGGEAMKGIKRRFARIMDTFLIPPGYEFQKAQQDYEGLLQGKELFDKDVAKLLDNAQSNKRALRKTFRSERLRHALLLQNLGYLRKVNYQTERILIPSPIVS